MRSYNVLIASKEQAFTQVPHPEHLSMSTVAKCFSDAMAA